MTPSHQKLWNLGGVEALVLNQRSLHAREATMKKSGPIVTLAIALAIAIPSTIYAQEGMKGEITKVDELKGTITIKQSPVGTVGASSESGTIRDFKVRDGLMFNAVKAGDKVVFTTETVDGNLSITKMQKE
jgi:Cu/Ag efflux protein CusF